MAIDLEELERLAAQATHLPWKVWERDDRYIVDASGKRELARVSMRYKPYPERAEYIAAACNAVPELIVENRKFQECVRELDRQNDFFLKALKENFMCPYSRCKYDDGSFEFQEWECDAENNRECWIKAAKEAGE